MNNELHCQVNRLLLKYQKAWEFAKAREIYTSVERVIAEQGLTGNANWDKALEVAQAKSQQLFQPALADLQTNAPIAAVLELLLARLEGPQT